jgi:putative membrane protein
MTLKKLLLMGCLGGALAFTACDKNDDDPIVTEQLNPTDRTFLQNAAQGNLAEIQTGQLAATQGSSDSVKMFGQLLVSDHRAAQNSLDSIATAQSIDLPDSADANGQAMYNALQGLSGASFDSAFIRMQVAAHDTAISMYQTYASAGSFTGLKNYANRILPILQQHASFIDSLDARLPQ